MKNIRVSLFSVFFLTLISCSEDFIDLAPISQMSEQNFYTTDEDFETALNAVYQSLHTLYDPEGAVSYFAELRSDNATFTSSAIGAERYAFDNFNLMSNNGLLETFWDNGYEAIARANQVIQELESSEIENKTRYMAEARFLRALFYFNHVRIFGDIPLVDRPITVEESYTIGRSSEEEIYNFIIEDLVFASNNLPRNSEISQLGRASEGAARGILAKVYLTAGEPGKAREELAAVINSNEYALVDEYSELWDVNNENTIESIFEVQFMGGASNPSSTYYADFAPFENFSVTVRGGGMNVPTQDIYQEYEENDVRREISLATGYSNREGNFVDALYVTKWTDENAEVAGQIEQGENNFMVLRYADVLLMYAAVTGDPEYLNMVRRRVGLPEWGSVDYPDDKYYSDDFDLAVEHERRVELAFEFHRLFDLKRTDRAIEVMSSKGYDITTDKLTFPIPLSVIDQNPLME